VLHCNAGRPTFRDTRRTGAAGFGVKSASLMALNRPQPRVTGNRYLISVAVMISALTAILDTTIVNVSVPNIQAAFGADIDQITWVLTGYLISNVVIIPMTGWLATRIGLKRYYMASQVVFVIASMLCGAAWNLPSLIFFRILQGIGGGALLPVSFSIMLEAFPPEETAQATAIFGAGTILGPIIGPTLGGWLTENFSWRWIFYVNLPIVLVGLFMTYIALHTPKREFTEKKAIDVLGLASAAIWLSTFQVVLQEGQRNDWFHSPLILWMTVVSVVAGVIFIYTELSVEHPFINLRIFKDYNFAVGNGMGSVVAAALFGAVFLIPVFSAEVLGYNSLDIGLSLLPGAVATLPLFALVARLVQRIDARVLCGFGFAVLTWSCWLNTYIDTNTSFWWLVFLNTTRSLALPFIFIPLTAIGIQNLPQSQKPEASALYNLTRTLGGSLAIAALGTFLVNRTAYHYARFSESVTQFGSQAMQRIDELQAAFIARSGSDAQTAHIQALGALKSELVRQSLIGGFDDAFRVLTVVSAVAVLLALSTRAPNIGPGQAPASALE
jgi:MFS transporter, DHA2 family, multidrug resistance protein